MCGIAGLLYADRARPCDAAVVSTMRDLMTYRGPDDSGIYLDGPLGLGFRRLSIIDLGGGHQPMQGPNPSQWIVFNGEIYNFRELREELIRKGHVFKTQSDTEVIVQLYAERGEQCVTALNGMFAFAIWDSEKRSLFLARDRMGVKPLYYAETTEGFAFGSEMKSVLASGLVGAECRSDAIAEYLMFRQVAGHETFFRGIRSLPPGCTLTIEGGRSRITRYWSPRPSAAPAPMAFEDAVARYAVLMEEAVRLRLVSDVPLGTFCSGGVDSSLVTALAAKLIDHPINTFSIGFDEADFDESAYALMVSKHCRTTHHQLRIGHAEFAELFPRMVWHNDEPLDFANSVHIFALSRLAKEFVTVVLTGEGSDELFAGYPRYRIPGTARACRWVPRPLRHLAASLSGDHRIAKLARFADRSEADTLLYNSAYVMPETVALLAPCLQAFDGGHRQAVLGETSRLGLDDVGRASLVDQESFLVSILHRQDKMSMAASIESRVPFMDYRMVEFANALPTSCKVRNGSGKAVVKAFARTLLPAEVVDRRKSGFGVPLAQWFRADEGLGERLLALPDMAETDFVDRQVLRRLIGEHRAGTHDHSELLWAVLNLSTWRETCRC